MALHTTKPLQMLCPYGVIFNVMVVVEGGGTEREDSVHIHYQTITSHVLTPSHPSSLTLSSRLLLLKVYTLVQIQSNDIDSDLL